MEINVKVSDLSFKYKTTEVLHSISFSLEQGKTYGLIGRNGAGKTTLLSLLASYMEPTSGTITMAGDNPFENRNIMPHVSFIYNPDYSDEYETATNYFEFAERYRPHFDMDYAIELAQRFKLPIDQPLKKLSSGMQSAFHVTLGLASRSPITIFDEAYQGMDAPARELFYQEVIAEQSRYARMMILSTHLVSEMDYLFDHVLILDRGSLLIDEPYDVMVNRGATITGPANDVDTFVSGMTTLHTDQLGTTKAVTVFKDLNEQEKREAEEMGLDVGPVSLQDLFIHLTEEED
ncbi:ATP-binding cassette domain-containing protein [Alteribacillus iranensis]|uniref:ABC-2 type transport system ATP-binding protein n=1 Tax=Alteribacillus iranensis TaxID=930128 RepID=A0A1I2FJM2_9BACI|nr:ABC transporter ATP-binding protein [Alteribacillus iranensis]SFF04661.1 ABC-2 type transport system ATP-binding protein [Alteribacillus iranensis]